MPVPKRSNRKNVPLADFNLCCGEHGSSQVQVCNRLEFNLLEFNPLEFKLLEFKLCRKVLCLQMCLHHQTHRQCHRGRCLCQCLRQVPRCSPSRYPQRQRTRKLHRGLTEMRLAHERGDPLPTVAEAKMQMAKAAIFRSNPLGMLDPQTGGSEGSSDAGGSSRSCHIPLVRATDQQDM